MNNAAILDELSRAVTSYPDWARFAPYISGRSCPSGVHIAVMVEPFLSYILDGSKTIESRFSKNLIAPYQRIVPGDLVFLKAGPIVAAFEASSVECVGLDDVQRRRLREHYSDPIRADEAFWAERANRNFATLIGIRDVQRLTPVAVPKHDRRGWMVLRAAHEADWRQMTLM
jgi:hypothetical protein